MMQIKRFGDYEILRKLGRSMTDVYLALDLRSGRKVVLKLIEQSSDPLTQLVTDAERRGASIQQQLHQKDPRVVEIYESGEREGYFYVAMEYIEGRSIADVLKTEGRLDPISAVRYALDVCTQLETLHSFTAFIDGQLRAVVHGDIKPSNIQLAADGRVRLLDFGIAKVITFTRKLTHHNMGSPSYCSPERLTRSQVDPQADLWALGVTLYEMVSGTSPYQAQNTRKLESLIQSRRAPRPLPRRCPAPLRAIIRKALAPNLEHRYQTASAFASDLRLFLSDRPTAAEQESIPVWESNATIDKTAPKALRKLVAGYREYVRLWKGPASAMALGLALGLLVAVPGMHGYRFYKESQPLREHAAPKARTLERLEQEWALYRKLEQKGRLPGGYSLVRFLEPELRGRYVATADRIIEGYRNSASGEVTDFDWMAAEASLRYALELDGKDSELRGKYALCRGYLELADLSRSAMAKGSLKESLSAVEPVKKLFEQAAADLPDSPDPHLGLANLYVRILRNLGGGISELAQAQRKGFQLGPRETELLADGYLLRAQETLREARRLSRISRRRAERKLWMARRDLERARNLYEPILGFSNVNLSLKRVDEEEQLRQKVLEQVRRADAEFRRQEARRVFAAQENRRWR